jgi:type VI secretion system secreted protein Hcp
MAFDTYMSFLMADGSTYLQGESQVQITSDVPLGTDIKPGYVFEIDDFSFDIEQIINMGSQSSGAGAGKITFNPYQITRKTDRISPTLFNMCCAGMHFQTVSLYLRRAGGQAVPGAAQASGTTFLRFDFALVLVATVSWSGSDGDEACKEEVTFQYGALQVRYQQQKADGTAQGGVIGQAWNRINNVGSWPPNGKIIAT